MGYVKDVGIARLRRHGHRMDAADHFDRAKGLERWTTEEGTRTRYWDRFIFLDSHTTVASFGLLADPPHRSEALSLNRKQ